MSENYVTLYQGLKVFRDAMLGFVKDRLEGAYGDQWWEQGVRRVFRPEDWNRVEKDFERRFAGLPVVTRPGTERYEILDINYFSNIIEGNWKQAFAQPFGDDRDVLVWLKEVTALRNAVMHFETGDLRDDDTWRGLDTMERIMRVVAPTAAQSLAQMEQDARQMSTQPEFRPAWFDLRDGPVDYAPGLSRLATAIAEQDGEDSETYLNFQGYRRQLITNLGEIRLTPGVRNDQLEGGKQRILRELDRLALQFMRLPFVDACASAPAPASPEENLRRIGELEREIADLQDKLYAKECKKRAQEQTGEVIAKLDRDIDDIQSQLDQRRQELAHLKEVASPPAFFAVERKVQAGEGLSFVEEQAIAVTVEITNLGRQAATIHYQEGLSDAFVILQGSLALDKEVSPGETVVLPYECRAMHAGQRRMFVQALDYPGRIQAWDRYGDTLLDIKPGTEPLLVASRHYRHVPEGLELLVHLQNNGDKIARQVKYCEMVEVAGQSESNLLCFEGDIVGADPGETVVCRVKVSEPDKVHVPEEVQITYLDSQGHPQMCVVPPAWKRIEYAFPRTPTDTAIVGRDAEVQVISAMVDGVWRLAYGGHRPTPKRLLFIEGIEGAGKTRLVHELLEQARRRGFRCFLEDAKNRSPIKTTLRRLLGLLSDENDDKLIWQRLENQLPGEAHSVQRGIIGRLIERQPAQFNESEMGLLEASVLALFKMLCEKAPTLLVFENIHWVPEGAEERLLLALLQSVLVSEKEPILYCATYRPAEIGPLPIVKRLRMPSDYYELLLLRAIGPQATKALVQQIVDFPQFSQPVHSFVCDWSHGNPLYLIELLRLLTDPDRNYLTRVGSEWYPAPGAELTRVIPPTIEDLIVERVNLQLPAEADFVKMLSAIGFELPLNLIEALSAQVFPEWPRPEVHRRLAVLENAGLLTVGGEGKESKVEGYEFEHQLKREVLYDSLPAGRRYQLRQQVAEILLSKQVFADSDEQTRQLARHVVKSPREFRVAHLAEIEAAAKLESGLRNFARSLEFYDAAIELAPDDGLQAARLLAERNQVHQMRGDYLSAERDLKQAYSLVSPESVADKRDKNEAKTLRILLQKERGRLLLRQPQGSMNEANDLLYNARVQMEGLFALKRFRPPLSREFHRDLVEIYLALAEVWLRKRNFRVCEQACRRAEKLALHAKTKLRDPSLLPDVYMALGDLHLKRGIKQEDYREALTWYRSALEHVSEDRYKQERVWLALADSYRVLDDPVEARAHYEKAVEIQKQLGDVYGLALSFGGIGDLFVEQKDFHRGRYYCEQAYEYQRVINDLDRFWRTCVSLTKIHLNGGDFTKAWGYWQQARAILFDQGRFGGLRIAKRRELRHLLNGFIEYHSNRAHWPEHRICLQDLEYALSFAVGEREESASVQMALGENCVRTQQWQEALVAFNRALELTESPNTRGRVHEWLGDAYAALDMAQATPGTAEMEEAQDEAERHYEEGVKQLVRTGAIPQALAIYEKLLGRIVSDQSGLLQLPFTFLRILREAPLQQRIYDQFVGKAEKLLLGQKLPAEAGDIVVYTARELARADNTTLSLDEKVAYLRRAEALYRQGTAEDLIWGFNMLIPTYFRLGLWDEVVRCFEELFELNIQIADVDEFIEVIAALIILEDRIGTESMERFTELGLGGLQRMQFTQHQQAKLFLYVAKCYTHIADKMDDSAEERLYNDRALEFYERAREMSAEHTAIRAVVLHDSGVIYASRKDYDEALSLLGESIRIKEQFGDYRGSAESRIMRANIYAVTERPDEAVSDYEQGLQFLQRSGDYWSERLQDQDQRPLSPAEVVSMRYEKDWLASACVAFAEFLLARGQLLRARDLAMQTLQICQAIGNAQRAERAQAILALCALVLGKQPAAVEEEPIGVVQQGWLCPSCGTLVAEGTSECPNCSASLCPECGAALEEEATECAACGAQFDLYCPQCNAKLSADQTVCPSCGLIFSIACPQCGKQVDLDGGLCPNCGQAICPKCGAAVGDDDVRCAACGKTIELFCPTCNGVVAAADIVCPHCGERFTEDDQEEVPG